MKTLTVNEMILNTIKTKYNKQPKYIDVLEKMGYEVYVSTWGYDRFVNPLITYMVF